MTIRITLAAGLLAATPLFGQAPLSAPAAKAAATITEADVRRRIGIIADDSMGGRNTPSPGLDKAARYIAAEFQRLGLRPGGDSGGYLLRYPISNRVLLPGQSTISLGPVSGSTVSTTLAEGAALVRGPSSGSASGSVVLLAGPVGPDSIRLAELKDRMVVYVPPATSASPTGGFGLLRRLGASAAAGVVIVVKSDSSLSELDLAQRRSRTTVGDVRAAVPIVAISESRLIAMHPEAAGQMDHLRTSETMVQQVIGDWQATVTLQDSLVSQTYAPDVVGILEGSDPALRNEYLVYSAHMDHVGTAGEPGASCRAVGADSICNGADDDGSGTVGILELAEAYTQKGARPKRSVIFLTVSGEEHGLWGSDWFVRHPPVPLPQIVADLNADMIGRNWADTIVAIGKEHSDLGATLNRVNGEHPELNMHAIDDRWPAENFYRRSDHFNFAQRGVPILFFFNGTHEDYHRPSDAPEKIDAEKEARIVRLLYFVGQEVANAKQRPQWVPASYQSIVTP